MIDSMAALMSPKAPCAIYAPHESRYQHQVLQPDPNEVPRLLMLNSFNRAEHRLRGWLTKSELLDDEDIDPPSEGTIEFSMAVLDSYRAFVESSAPSDGMEYPRCVGVAVGPGGSVTLEFVDASRDDAAGTESSLVLEVSPSGSVEFFVFADGRLAHRGWLAHAARS